MGATGEAAKKVYEWVLEGASSYDAAQYSYVTDSLLNEFRSQIFSGFVANAWNEINSRFEIMAAGKQSGNVSPGLDVENIEAYVVGDKTRAVSFKRPSEAQRLLFAWSSPSENNPGCARLFTWKEHFPDELLKPLLSKLGDVDYLGHREIKQVYNDYTDYTFQRYQSVRARGAESLDVILESIKNDGLEKAGGRCVAWCRVFEPSKWDDNAVRAVPRLHGWRYDLNAIKHVQEFFAPNLTLDVILNVYEEKLKKFVASVSWSELQSSIAALNIEDKMSVFEGRIRDMFAAAEGMGLTNETCLAYNDNDIRLNLFKVDGKWIYLHDNIDLFQQKVLAMIFHERDGKFESVDLALCKSWFSEPEEPPVEKKEYLLSMFADNVFWHEDYDMVLVQDEFVEEVLLDKKPGLIGSFDFKTKVFSEGPLFEKTDLLSGLGGIIEYDYKAICQVSDDEDDNELPYVSIYTRPVGSRDVEEQDHFEIDDWTAALKETRGPRSA